MWHHWSRHAVAWQTLLAFRYARTPGDPDAGQGLQTSSARDLPSTTLPADATVLVRWARRAPHLWGSLRAAGGLLADWVLTLCPTWGCGEVSPGWGLRDEQSVWLWMQPSLRGGGCEEVLRNSGTFSSPHSKTLASFVAGKGFLQD